MITAGITPKNLGWANQIASDYKLIPLGRLVRLRREKNDPIKETQILSLTADRGVILYEEKGSVGNQASEDISRYSIVRTGDIVVNSMNVIIGSVGLSKYDGVLSPVYYVLTPINPSMIDMRYLAYHFQIKSFQQGLVRIGYGILDHRMRIPWINLAAELIVVPPIEEQRRIADYLDERLETINQLIKLNLEKNLKLAEIIFSIIKEAYEPYPSRIPLKYLVSETRHITYGIVQAGENYYAGIPYIRPVDMTERNGVISEEELLRTSPDIAQSYKRSEVKENDLVVSIGPSFGKVMVVPKSLEGANLTQGTARVSISSEYSKDAIFWWLQSKEVKDFWNSSIGGATFHALNLEPLAQTPTPIISKNLGDELSIRLATRVKIVEEMRNQIDKINTKLIELKASLIAESVLGSLDNNKQVRMQ